MTRIHTNLMISIVFKINKKTKLKVETRQIRFVLSEYGHVSLQILENIYNMYYCLAVLSTIIQYKLSLYSWLVYS